MALTGFGGTGWSAPVTKFPTPAPSTPELRINPGPGRTDPTPVRGGPPASTTPTATNPSAAQLDAKAQVVDALNQYGLGSLADWAWQKLLNGETVNQILIIDAPQTAEFKQRFPAIGKLAAQGVAITPGDYVSYEKQAMSQFHAAGLTGTQWDSPTGIDNLIANQVSASELSSRLNLVQSAVQQAPAEARNYLRANFGITNGDLANYFLDPSGALPDLQMKAQAAQIGGAAAQTGYGYLDVQKAMNLAAMGVSTSQAQSGFGKIASEKELTQNLGDGTGSLTGNDLIDAQLGGNGDAALKLQQVAAGRVAKFQSGGTYTANQGGVSGLGVGPQGF